METVQFVGFSESREARAAQVASELGVENFTVERLLDSVDAVTIAVPTPYHFAVASAALSRGKHVLVEKPIAATVDEADRLLELAQRSGALIQTGHVERFNRAVRAALPYVSEPRFIESDRLAPFQPRGSDVAVVLDLMIHDIDLILTIVGADVTTVAAAGVPVLTPMVDIANARLGFASGAVANITASRISRERVRKVRIFQQNGYISLDLAAGTGEFFELRRDLDLAKLTTGPVDIGDFVNRFSLTAPEGEPLRLEFESFVSAITGQGSPVVSGEDGRRALAVALRIVSEIERALSELKANISAGAHKLSGQRGAGATAGA
jgi:predicted dehydrogenase